MNADPTAQAGEPPAGASAGSATSSEEERARAAYEAELSRISSADMMLQAAVSLLNIGARRLAPAEDGGEAASARPEGSAARGAGAAPAPAKRDLEQVRDAIDGVSALLGILERRIPETLGPLRDALAQLQLAYAREARAAPADADQAGQQPGEGGTDSRRGKPGEEEEQAGESSPEGEGQQRGPGPAEASGRLWVPGH